MNCQKKYSSCLINNPIKFFCGFLLCNFLITGGLIASGSLGFTAGGNFDWVISDNQISRNNDALRLAYSKTDDLTVIEKIEERSRQSQTHNLGFIYQWKDNSDIDIFNPKNLQTICNVEKILFDDPEYDKFCYSQNSVNCSDIFTSVTNLFYPNNHNWDCPLLSNNVVNNQRNLIYQIENNNDNSPYGFFLSKDFEKNGYTERTRTNINLGEPLNGYISAIDKPAEQREKYLEFFKKIENKLWKYFNLQSSFFRSPYLDNLVKDDLQVKFYSWDLSQIEFNRVVNGDMIMTLCAIVFVFIWIFVHVGSAFIASFSMLQIIFSMPTAFLVYRYVFGINYFTQLHGCAIFLALGIGADDIFVFSDAWKQSKHDPELNTKLKRLEFTFRRTLIAVFNTSFTTTVAFLSTAISPAMPISSFGIYAALTIIFNYFFVLIFTPALTLIYDKYIQKRCACKKKVIQISSETKSDNTVSELGLVYKFFDRIYYPFISYSFNGIKVISLIIVLGLTGYGVFSFYYAAQLSPPVEQERWFTGGHMYNGFVDSMTNDFKSNNINEYSEITLAWGIKGVDRSKFNRWEPNDFRGTVQFNEDFDISSDKVQQHLLRACDLIKNWECNEEGCSGYKGRLAFPNKTICYLEDFNQWNSETLLNRSHYMNKLLEFRSNTMPDDNIKTWKNYIGSVKKDVKYVTVTFRSTLKSLQPMKVKEPIYAIAENLVKKINENAPNVLGESFQDAGITWVWFDIERTLISSMFTGLYICFPVSFLVLLFATFNWYLSLISIISIAFVVGNVLGFCSYFMGWTLGIAETVASVIVIGFSIDYTLHIGHMYQESSDLGMDTRNDRTRYALERMGTTVLAGAITTAGSAMFMFACQMTFFYKMAVLISITIFFSLIYSLGFLISCMILFGPEKRFGSIKPLFNKCKK